MGPVTKPVQINQTITIGGKNPLALIVGGEAQGASDQARELANTSVSISMPGQAESLNASVAGAVLIFEVVRQRN